ncbi:Sec-independent protein translocase protein TatB [Thiorhodococcus fuscus]|uniref:Sec-independent protein translocase protein TatB n=1 Tax=Thiorhodococcus fuscus TaxID=527200 RepID=A0ABW4YDH4_9GAMM
MFDIGFTELLLIGVVALVVLGPERLPKVARVAGMWVGKARRTLASVKQEIDRELKAEELKTILERQSQIDPLESILEETPKTTSSQSTPNAQPSPAKPEPPARD